MGAFDSGHRLILVGLSHLMFQLGGGDSVEVCTKSGWHYLTHVSS